MPLKELVFWGMLGGILVLSLSCENNHHDDMHDRMIKDEQMSSGQHEMMDEGQKRSGSQRTQQLLTLEQARQRAEEYLRNTGNKTLKIGEGTERGDEYEFPLIRKSNGSRIASLLVNKLTGEVHSRR